MLNRKARQQSTNALSKRTTKHEGMTSGKEHMRTDSNDVIQITTESIRTAKHQAPENSLTCILDRGIARSSNCGAEDTDAGFRDDVQTRCGFFFMRTGLLWRKLFSIGFDSALCLSGPNDWRGSTWTGLAAFWVAIALCMRFVSIFFLQQVRSLDVRAKKRLILCCHLYLLKS